MESPETNIKNESVLEEKSSVGGFFWDLLKIFIIAFIITAPFRLFVAEPFVVSGASMVPTFQDKDYLIVDRWTYRNSEVKRGDVIVFKYPKDTSQYFIKRIIGLPGETVKIEKGHVVIINSDNPEGFTLPEDYLPKSTQTLGIAGRTGQQVLGSDEYFVLGDNRNASSDSRMWGILPKDDIIGRAFLRVLPFNHFGVIRGVNY